MFDRGNSVANDNACNRLHHFLKMFQNVVPVSVSTAERQSSKIRICGFLINALAIEIRCFCPPESETPRSPT